MPKWNVSCNKYHSIRQTGKGNSSCSIKNSNSRDNNINDNHNHYNNNKSNNYGSSKISCNLCSFKINKLNKNTW